MRYAFWTRSNCFALQICNHWQVRWGNWRRPDGSNTTWDNSLVPADIVRDWERKQRLRRAARAKRSTAIRIPGTLCITDMMSFVRSEALQEILETQDTSTLKQTIEKVTSDTDMVSFQLLFYPPTLKISLFPPWNRASETLRWKKLVHHRARLRQLSEIFFKR